MTKIHILTLLLATGPLIGCASVENSVISPPGGVYSSLLYTDNATLDDHKPRPAEKPDLASRLELIDWLLPIVEISNSGFIYRHGEDAKTVKDKDKPPVYLAYDLSRLKRDRFDILFAGDNEEPDYRNLLVYKILDQSNRNFNNFYARIMGFDRGNTLLGKTINTLATGAAGGTALISGPAGAGIATANLVGSATQQNFKDSFLGGGTIGSVLTAMDAARQNYELTIINKLYIDTGDKGNRTSKVSPMESYSIEQVLGDIDHLSAISTLDGALKYISEESAKKTQATEKAMTDIASSQKPMSSLDLKNRGIQ